MLETGERCYVCNPQYEQDLDTNHYPGCPNKPVIKAAHIERVANDIRDFVAQCYPDRLEELEGEYDIMVPLRQAMELHPPGMVLTQEYREGFVSAFASAIVDMDESQA